MRIKLILALTTICLLLAGNTSFAVTLKSYSGDCEKGNPVGNWTVVITFNDDGQPIRAEGIGCDGLHWVNECPRVGILGDPGRPSTHYTELANGAWIRFNATAIGGITDMWGRDANGQYWRSTSGTNPSENLN